jgi:hypothetical protein
LEVEGQLNQWNRTVPALDGPVSARSRLETGAGRLGRVGARFVSTLATA